MEEKEIVSNDKVNSVEFTSSTKGVLSFKVKAYAETIDEAFEKAVVFSDKCKRICEINNEGIKK